MKVFFGRLFVSGLLGAVMGPILGAQAPVAGQAGVVKPPAAARVSCTVRSGMPSDAELALSRQDYPVAMAMYQSMAQKTPDESRAGVIRVLIEQNKIQEADGLAKRWTTEQPQSAAAVETLGEVLFRQAQMSEAIKILVMASKLDPCNARSSFTTARILRLAGLFASSRKDIEQAHKLDPVDVEIRRSWIDTLPRKRRLEELAALMNDPAILNAKDRGRMADSLAHANDYSANDCRQEDPKPSSAIPMQELRDGPHRLVGIGLDVYFNGKRRRLELDTGASGIILSRDASSGLGLTKEETREAGGIGDDGRVSTSVAHVESIKIGDIEFKNCPVELLDKRGRLEIDGLIGANVFARYLVTLDYPALQVRLDPMPKRPGEKVEAVPVPIPAAPATTAAGAPTPDKTAEAPPVVYDRYIAPEMQDWTKIYRSGHLLLVPVSIGQTKDLLFVVDTGAGLMSISPEAAKLVTKVDSDDSMHVRGISGEVNKVYSTRDFTLMFAHLGEKVDSMTAFDTTSNSHNIGTEISGFLGRPILKRLTLHIDYRDNLIKFDYDKNKDPGH